VKALAACGGTAAVKVPPSPKLTGSAAYLADVRHVGLGTMDVAGATDDSLIKLGNTECQGFSDGQPYGAGIEVLTGAGKNISTQQADALVRSAVRNLCPAEAATLP
jgi:hypothetical protein